MWGGAIDQKIIDGLIDGSFVCGSTPIKEDELKTHYSQTSINTTGTKIDNKGKVGLYKANGNLYLIAYDKAPTRIGPSGPVLPTYVEHT